ncbi:MAG: hypothetical protein ACT4N2_13330 [Hyphomicrobium sp.]
MPTFKYGTSGNDWNLRFDMGYSTNDWNYMYGREGHDTMYSGAHNDYLVGGTGDDMMVVADDRVADYFIGEDGSDTVQYASATAGVDVNLARLDNLGQSFGAGAAVGDVFVGIESVMGSRYGD